MRRLAIAFSLLTVLPVRAPHDWRPGDSGRAAAWYPFVGLAVGALAAAALILASLVIPPLVAGALALAAWVALTGGLHLDGLADCCDGLLYAGDAGRRLEIMKDPRLGAFGGIGLALALLLKGAALASLAPERALLVLPLAASLGRWAILPAGFQPLARPGGMGADLAAGQPAALFLRRHIVAPGVVVEHGLERGEAVQARRALDGDVRVDAHLAQHQEQDIALGDRMDSHRSTIPIE